MRALGFKSGIPESMSYKFIVRNPRGNHANGLVGRLQALATRRPAAALAAVLGTGVVLGVGVAIGVASAQHTETRLADQQRELEQVKRQS